MQTRFGKLEVIKSLGFRDYASKSVRFFLCKCDCGREMECAQMHLTGGRYTACKVCNRGPCSVCGGPVDSGMRRSVCSRECAVRKNSAKALERYHKQTSDQRLVLREKQRVYRRKLRAKNPEVDRRQSVYYKQWYQKNRERILEYKREKAKEKRLNS